MDPIVDFIIRLASFLLVALAAHRIGLLFGRIGLPKITGYLVTGLLAGPFILNMLPAGAPEHLLFVDEVSLAFIAFAAGSELYLPELKGRLRSIGWVTGGLVLFTFTLGLIAVLLLADSIPFVRQMDTMGRLAVALLVAAILVARSPSSAIAIVNELRAKGPFTQVALGVTVISDVVVIVVFAISSSVADTLLTGLSFSPGFVGVLAVDLLLAAVAGYGLFRLLDWILSRNVRHRVKMVAILLAGYGVFVLAEWFSEYSHHNLPIEILIEPLLVCLIASFLVNNRSAQRLEMAEILHQTGPTIYVLFFALTGASLKLDLLLLVWPVALALFAVRAVAIGLGSFLGGAIAGDSAASNRVKWMVFLTQAGVALGLAKEVAVEFPVLGNDFATLIIAVVVINETIGPLFFKQGIKLMGEAHLRAEGAEFDGVRDVIIFGDGGQTAVLGRQLESHGWQVKLVCPATERATLLQQANGLQIHPLTDISLDLLQSLQTSQADAIVTMLSDDENYRLCQLAYEHFGTELLVVMLNDRANTARFQQFDALVVDPSLAIVSLLDHVVRAPSAASILLGLDDEQDIIDLEVRDSSLDGMLLRNVRLPLDTVVMSIRRDGQLIIPHGYTRLLLGDHVTVIGTPENLEAVTVRFDAN